MLKGFSRDLISAVKSLSKARGFTFVCVISLGIGMTPIIAIPYASRITRILPADVNVDRLAEVVTTSVGPRSATSRWSYPDYVDLRDADTGATMFGWAGGESEITFQTAAASKGQASTMYVPANYFKTLGIGFARGVGFDAVADDPLRAEPVVVLTNRFWEKRFGADPEAVGKTLTIDGVQHVIVGILPGQFEGHIGFGQGWELFLPLERHPTLRPGLDRDKSVRADRAKEWLGVYAQLKPGVTVKQASAAIVGVTARLAKTYPTTNEFKAGVAEPYDPLGVLQRPQFRMIQAVGFTLTGMVLLIVALNVSGMMQVRSALREKELSIRQAIGATRARLAQYLLSEAIVLAFAGGTLSSLLIFNLPALISRLSGQPIPTQFQLALRVDPAAIGVSFGLCLLTSLIFGWLPAMRFSRPVIISSLKDDAGGGGFRVGKVHRVTAALQVAIAVPLMVMSGQSIDRVRATATKHLGFESNLLYAAPLTLDGLTLEQAGFQIRKSRDTIAQASGVAAVTVADGLPLDFRYRMASVALQVDANTAPRFISVQTTRADDRFLETVGIPLVRGRGFTTEDRAGSEPVTVVSKPLADKLAPDGDVIGKRLLFGADKNTQKTLTIIGVTADFPTSQMSTAREQVLLPLAQYPRVNWDTVGVDDDRGGSAHVMVIARSVPGEQPQKMTALLENMARELDPQFPSTGVITGAWLRKHSMDDFLTQSMVAAIAGSVVLLLAALGIYGVVGLMVATRTREIAVRAALGASRRRVIVMIIRDVVKLVLPGVVVGMVLTLVLNRINAENMGVSLSELEPLAYVAGALVAVLVAVVASLAPARRAASVEPMVAMRST